MDDLQCIYNYNLNGFDIAIITETWKEEHMPDEPFNLTGYWPLANKDRVGIKGGVWPYMWRVQWKNLEEEHIVSKWITVRPKKLPREIPILIVGAIYHPPKNDNLAAQFAMILHIQTSLEQILQKHPNAGIILRGDLNKLKTLIVASGFHLKQIVNVSTRKKNTLEKSLINLKKNYLDPFTVGKLENSDHEIVVAVPSVPKSWQPPKRNSNLWPEMLGIWCT